MIIGRKVRFTEKASGLAHKECFENNVIGVVRGVGVMEYNAERYFVVETPIHNFPLYCSDEDITWLIQCT